MDVSTRTHAATGPSVHVRCGLALAAVVTLLAALDLLVGLGPTGWAVGVGTTAAGVVLVHRSVARHRHTWGPADDVTAARAVLAVGVAALAVGSADRPHLSLALLSLAIPALLLDGVDGWVARRTATSRFGARFDMETDALLILALSVAAAPAVGWWVLSIGLARYALLAAAGLMPWLRRETPPRFWAKVVAAVQALALVLALSGTLPIWASRAALVVALGLLVESFAFQIRALSRQRPARVPAGWMRRKASALAPWLAFALVWASLVAPDRVDDLRLSTPLRIPIELLALTAVTLTLPHRWARRMLSVAGTAIGVLVVLHVADGAFYLLMDRPFDPTGDWSLLAPGVDVLADSVGQAPAIATAVAAGVAAALVVVLVPVATLRFGEAARGHRRGAVAFVLVLGSIAAGGRLLGVQVPAGNRLSTAQASAFAYAEARRIAHDLRDRQTFASAIADDRFADVPADRLLTALQGKDVLLIFVESYGRVAVQDTSYSVGVSHVLDEGTRQLRQDGYRTRSAFLTSPTFGGASWLAHSTLQSGVWVDSQRRYTQLLDADRLTLTAAFAAAGWRTVFDVPSIRKPWPEGAAFYGFDQLYDAHNVDYRGPEFGYASMPDQFTLATFRRRELGTGSRTPVMAEIDLVSSHHPWAPLPRLVPWDTVGDGSVFDPMPAQGESSERVLADSARVRDAYGRSVEYSWRALISWLNTYRDPNLVLVVLGDHQPHGYVTGPSPGHDVPVTVIWSDPTLSKRTRSWGWEPGLRPSPEASVWRMDEFRDRFLAAFGPNPLALASSGP